MEKNRLVAERNYHAINWFPENVLEIEIKKTRVTLSKPVYVGLSMLHMSNIIMYVYWYKYTKLKYGDNTKVCYTDKGCFIVHVKP